MLTLYEIDEVLSKSKSWMYMTQFELGLMYAMGKNRMLSLFMVHVRGLELCPTWTYLTCEPKLLHIWPCNFQHNIALSYVGKFFNAQVFFRGFHFVINDATKLHSDNYNIHV